MSNQPTTKLRTYSLDKIIVIEMDGNIQQGESDELEELLYSLYEDQHLKMIINLERVSNICSTALGLLVRFKSFLNERGGDLKIVMNSPRVFELFKITMLDKVFETMDNMQEAVNAF